MTFIQVIDIQQGLQDGLHIRDRGFGGVVLLVCALGARYSTDPRVLLNSNERPSAGWMWFVQVSRMASFHCAKITFNDSVLYELQTCAVSAIISFFLCVVLRQFSCQPFINK